MPCTSTVDVQNLSASTTEKAKSILPQNSSTFSVSRGFVHAKPRTRIGCWNVRSLGSLSDQSAHLLSVIDIMKSKSIDLLALSESRWPGNGISAIRSTTVLHSSTPSSHLHGVAILPSPLARSA